MNKATRQASSVKVGLRNQVTIPKKMASRLRITPGSFVEVKEERGIIMIAPQMLVSREDAWFWSPEWQAMEREADEAEAHGKTHGHFSTWNETKCFLDGLKKKSR